jgi:O-antigen/teichoic acid export membrane protein
MMLWMLPRATATVLLPSVAAGGEGGAALPAAARIGRLVFTATLLGAAPAVLLSRFVIGALYGHDFAPAAVPFSVLLVGCVPFTLCVIQASALAGMDRQDVNMKASVVGLVATVALDLALIPRFGIVGAAAASAVSYLITMVMVLFAFARLGNLSVRACVIPRSSDFGYLSDGLKSLLR